jgi:hypothetical protein
MESAPDVQTDRRLGGSIADSSVRLVVFDANLMTRRKAWNIEFKGSMVPTEGGTVLGGTIEIADIRRASAIVWGGRAVVAVIALAVLVQAVNQTVTGASIFFAVVVGTGLLVGFALLEAQGHRDAARDAQHLTRYLKSALS